MTREEAIKIACQNGGHPYSRNAMADMLILGEEMGRKGMIMKAYQWLKARNVLTDVSLDGFIKAMEE